MREERVVLELDSLTHRPSFTLVIAARSERRESGVWVGLIRRPSFTLLIAARSERREWCLSWTHSQTKFHTTDSSQKWEKREWCLSWTHSQTKFHTTDSSQKWEKREWCWSWTHSQTKFHTTDSSQKWEKREWCLSWTHSQTQFRAWLHFSLPQAARVHSFITRQVTQVWRLLEHHTCQHAACAHKHAPHYVRMFNKMIACMHCWLFHVHDWYEWQDFIQHNITWLVANWPTIGE